MRLTFDFEESNSFEQHRIADTTTIDDMNSRNLKFGWIKYVMSVVIIY